AERHNPKLIDGSRRARIARGSGRTVTDVNQLVDRFFEARKMMLSMARGGGMPGMPGVLGQPGAGKRGKGRQQQRSKNKRVSGNPAKAAQQRAAAAQAAAERGGSPFGSPGAEEIDYEKAAAALDLKDFSKYLK
ncbi:MAG: signal recognition particle protein, partial [Nocardioides sp.]